MQLSFHVIDDAIHKANIETGYWIDVDSGEISKTENIRPYKAAKYIQSEDSSFGVYQVPVLYRYPGGMNRRIRWEDSNQTDMTADIYKEIVSKAEASLGEAVKKAKNELKNTLSDEACAMLIPFDSIQFAVSDGHGVLKYGEERKIFLCPIAIVKEDCAITLC